MNSAHNLSFRGTSPPMSEFKRQLARNPVLTKAGSRFADNIWDLSEEAQVRRPKSSLQINFRMQWTDRGSQHRSTSFLPNDAPLSHYPQLYSEAKTLFAAALLIPRNITGRPYYSPMTLFLKWQHFRSLIELAVSDNRHSLSEITGRDVEAWLKMKRKQAVADALRFAYLYSDVLDLKWAFSAVELTAAVTAERYGSKIRQTRAIHQQDFIALIKHCLDFIEARAKYILYVQDLAERFRRNLMEIRRARGCGDRSQFVVKGEWDAFFSDANASYRHSFSEPSKPVESYRDFYRQTAHLRYAATTLLLALTGMRIEELALLRRDGLMTSTENGVRRHWLISRHIKNSDRYGGQEAKWLCGEEGARAFGVLLRLGKRHHEMGCPYLVTSFDRISAYKTKKATRRSDSLSSVVLSMFLPSPKSDSRWTSFLRSAGIRDMAGNRPHIYPHQFRRMFAQWCARVDNQTNLIALQDHFKHAAYLMTHHYAVVDEDLLVMFCEELDSLRVESMDKLLVTEAVAGVGGLAIKHRVDNAISSGALPKDFRGRACAKMRMEVAIDLLKSGVRVQVCGGHLCVPLNPHASCDEAGGGFGCNRGTCENAAYLPEHAPGLAAQISNDRRALALMHRIAPDGPQAKALQRMIEAQEAHLKRIWPRS